MSLFREIPAASEQGEARWKFFKKKTIGRNTVRGPMLIRYIIVQTPLFGLYVHNILREDADRDCHDHPWRFTTLVLRGGYIEDLRCAPGIDMSQHMYRLARSLHTMPTRYSHKIMSVEPNTWTLLVVGRKVRDWGFWTEPPRPSGYVPQRGHYTLRWIPWREYNRGLTPDPMDS